MLNLGMGFNETLPRNEELRFFDTPWLLNCKLLFILTCPHDACDRQMRLKMLKRPPEFTPCATDPCRLSRLVPREEGSASLYSISVSMRT